MLYRGLYRGDEYCFEFPGSLRWILVQFKLRIEREVKPSMGRLLGEVSHWIVLIIHVSRDSLAGAYNIMGKGESN